MSALVQHKIIDCVNELWSAIEWWMRGIDVPPEWWGEPAVSYRRNRDDELDRDALRRISVAGQELAVELARCGKGTLAMRQFLYYLRQEEFLRCLTIWESLFPRLEALCDRLRYTGQRSPIEINQAASPPKEVDRKPDGPEGGCWLWWKGTRHDVPKGVLYRLLDFMWMKDSAKYDDLKKPVFDDTSVTPGTIRGRVSEVNKVLEKSGVPWHLKTDATARCLTKHPIG